MKSIFLLLIPVFIFSKIHYAKVEPYETFNIKSSVSSLVMDTNLDAEGMVSSGTVVILDSKLDNLNLEASKKSISNIKSMLGINKSILVIQKKAALNNEDYFKRISKLSTISKTQKDDAFTKYTTSQTQYLATKEKILTLEKQLIDLEYKVDQLEDSIEKKTIKVNNKFVSQILVTPGDFVNPSTPLIKVEDLTRAKLVIYLDKDELDDINKSVYINDEKTDYKLNKLWKTTDEKFISSYKAEIYLDSSYSFSTLVKVEIK